MSKKIQNTNDKTNADDQKILSATCHSASKIRWVKSIYNGCNITIIQHKTPTLCTIQASTRNSSGDEIAKRDVSVYLFIVHLYINSCIVKISNIGDMPDSSVWHILASLGTPVGQSR